MVVQFGELDFEQRPEPHQPLRRHRARGARGARRRGPEPAPARRRAAHATTRRPLDDRREAHAVHRRRRSKRFTTGLADAARAGRRCYAPGRDFGDHIVEPPRRRRPTPRSTRLVGDYPVDITRDLRRRAVLLALLAVRRRARATSSNRSTCATPRTSSASACCCCCSASPSSTPPSSCSLPFFVRAPAVAGAARPRASSAVYFAALGLGFMFFEITMIQRLDAVPRLSDVLAHRHARVDPRFDRHRRAAEPALRRRGVATSCRSLLARARRPHRLLPVRARRRSPTSLLVDEPRGARRSSRSLVLAPLGLCLGMFMPLGLGARRRA